jgi:DNA-directed RNA polymerase specialized sigma subunit
VLTSSRQQQIFGGEIKIRHMSYMKRGESELDAIVSLLVKMPLESKKVLAMYYHENMRLLDIATCLGITESKVFQIHAQSVGSIRLLLVK